MSNGFLRSRKFPWRWLLAISLVLLTLHPLPAQEEVLPVEEAEARLVRQWKKSTSGLYFQDINHVLDKFEGTWKGCNADGYELLLKLKVFTKVYDPVYRSHTDLLGLQMEIRKDGMALLAPLDARDLIPGTPWYRGSRVDWDYKERRADPNAYSIYLNFDNLKSEGYWGRYLYQRILVRISKPSRSSVGYL